MKSFDAYKDVAAYEFIAAIEQAKKYSDPELAPGIFTWVAHFEPEGSIIKPKALHLIKGRESCRQGGHILIYGKDTGLKEVSI